MVSPRALLRPTLLGRPVRRADLPNPLIGVGNLLRDTTPPILGHMGIGGRAAYGVLFAESPIFADYANIEALATLGSAKPPRPDCYTAGHPPFIKGIAECDSVCRWQRCGAPLPSAAIRFKTAGQLRYPRERAYTRSAT